MPRAAAGALAILLIAARPADAASPRVYRYQAEDGGYVYTTQLPPAAVARGYQVLNHKGRILECVPGELSPEQLAAREARRARATERAAVRERDRELLRLYASPKAVTRAMQRRLASIAGAIDIARARMERLQRRKRSLEMRAARRERAGRALPETLLATLNAVEHEIDERERRIDARQKEMEQTRARFRSDRRRLQAILGTGGSGS